MTLVQDRLHLGRNLTRARDALRAVLLEHAIDQVDHGHRRAGAQRFDVRYWRMQDGRYEASLVIGLKRRVTYQHLEQHRAERP